MWANEKLPAIDAFVDEFSQAWASSMNFACNRELNSVSNIFNYDASK